MGKNKKKPQQKQGQRAEGESGGAGPSQPAPVPVPAPAPAPAPTPAPTPSQAPAPASGSAEGQGEPQGAKRKEKKVPKRLQSETQPYQQQPQQQPQQQQQQQQQKQQQQQSQPAPLASDVPAFPSLLEQKGRGRGRWDSRGRGRGRGGPFSSRGLQELGESLVSEAGVGRASPPTSSTPKSAGIPPQAEQPPQPTQIQQPRRQQPPQQRPPQEQPAQQQPPQQRPPQEQPAQQRPPQQRPPQQRPPQQQPPQQQSPQQQSPQQQPSRQQPQVSTQFSTTSIVPRGGYKIPVREKLEIAGTKGRKIAVATNHLELNLQNLRTQIAWHYDVSIDPDKPKRLLRRVVEEFRLQRFPDRYPAFDGRKNMYSASQLPFDHKRELQDTIQILDQETQKEKEFKIVIKYATQVDLTSLSSYMRTGTSLDAPQQAIQVLDVVLRCAPALRFVPVGRSYFTPPTGQVCTLGDGYEIWYGLFQSVNLGWQPFVNVDVVHKGFPTSQLCINALRELYGDFYPGSEIPDHQLSDFRKFLSGLKIDYQIPGNPSSRRTYKVNDVVEPASRLLFEHGGKKISVLQYFEKEKKIPLKHKNLPCLHVGSLNRPNPIYVPLEFCTIVAGQVVQKKLNEKQTSNMIRQAATSTMDRERKIRDALAKAGFNQSPQVREFGLQVNEKFKEVKARILDPPQLEYSCREPIIPTRGVWQAREFLNGSKLEKWIVLVLDYRVPDDTIRNFYSQFINQGRKLGMNISQPYPMRKMDSRKIKLELEPFLRDKAKEGFELVVVVVPERGNDYAFVKQTAELTLGLLTQCVKSSTMQRRMNFATAQNILLKVNSKLNGINHIMHTVSRPVIFSQPIMIVGADVTHPSPDETKIPSVAAVCASHDPRAFQYNTQFRLQPARMEIIEDLEAIMKQQLIFFYTKTRYKPQRILFYRDGVSEGQFQQVLNSELTAIRSACSKLEPAYKPSITFLVVQKRHHTRFFPLNDREADGRNRNVMPGTIVDTTITHPTERDFYLVSHASIQGVSRPTKYHCLWDDNKLSEDELEELTYYLCHMFSRCTRSVSYPAPTYYAHLAAYRARVYLSGRNIPSYADAKLQTELLTQLQKQSPMYFV